MKKSLIALAVAGAFAAPAFAATSNVDVYGIMNIAIQDTNGTNNELAVVNNASRIGFKGSEDLGGGLKAVWQIEQQLDGTTGNDGVGTGSATFRNTFVGMAGGFGTVLMGRHDTPYKMGTGSLDIFGDTIGDYNGRGMNAITTVDPLEATHDARSASAIAYVSPTWNGFHFAVATVASDVDATVAGQRQFDAGNDNFEALSATGVYSNGPLFASLSYQDVFDTAAAAGDQSSTAWKLGLGYSFGDAKVGFLYEDINNDTGAAVNGGVDRDSWTINGVYNMGPIALKAQYSKLDKGTSVDPDVWSIGADYSLSKRTTAYFVYSSADDDDGVGNDDGKGWNLGVKHSF